MFQVAAAGAFYLKWIEREPAAYLVGAAAVLVGSGVLLLASGPDSAAARTARRLVDRSTNGATTDSGQIYRLLDNGSSLTPDTSGNWSGRNPFSCGCTITTPLNLDTTNLYWGGTTGGGQRVFRLAVVQHAIVDQADIFEEPHVGIEHR